MGFIRKHPFESIVFLVLTFTYFVSREWVGSNYWHKVSALVVFGVFTGLILLLRFSFGGFAGSIKKVIYQFLQVEAYRGSMNLVYLIKLSIVGFLVMLLVAVLEFFIEMVLYNNFPPISVGIPFTIYSFSALRLVLRGFLLNTVFYGLITKVVFETTLREDN